MGRQGINLIVNLKSKTMKTTEKKQIQEQLITYVARYESQNEAAKSLRSVSAATISQIINNNWELIKDEMWRNIAAQIDFKKSDWEIVKTVDNHLITSLLSDSQITAQVYAVVGSAGTGKSTAIKQYESNNKSAYAILCSPLFRRKQFLQEILLKMGRGKNNSGKSDYELKNEIIDHLKKKENPLIILDEFDKLSPDTMLFFIDFYNKLEGYCGIVMFGTEHLAKHIKRGVLFNKKGYEEIYSRIGRKFVELHGLGYTDCVQICVANGIEDKNLIKQVFEDCEGDIRRIKRKIHAIKMSNQKQAA